VDLVGKYAFGDVKKPEDGGKTQGGKQ